METFPDIDALKNIVQQSPMIQSRADVPATQPVTKAPEYDGPSNPNGETIVAVDPALSSPAPVPVTKPGPSVAPPAEWGPLSSPETPPAPAEPTQENAPANTTQSRIFFTGRTGVGKDWLAQRAQAQVLNVTTFLTDIVKGEFPSVPPKDTASFLSTVFAWGEGIISKDYPVTPARFLFLRALRTAYPKYGQPGFWVGLIIEEANRQSGLVAVTGVSSPTAMKALSEAGFKHWHVMTSPQTYATRAKRPGADDKLAANFDQQAIAQNSANRNGPKMSVIWNCTTPPPSARLWTVDEWLQETSGAQQSIGAFE